MPYTLPYHNVIDFYWILTWIGNIDRLRSRQSRRSRGMVHQVVLKGATLVTMDERPR